MAKGWYELNKNDKGQFFFNLKAGNAQVILTSQMYKTAAGAKNGIASARKNSGNEALYEVKTAKNGKSHFNLKAKNSQVIGSSQMYASQASAQKGIQSVKTNGASETVKNLIK